MRPPAPRPPRARAAGLVALLLACGPPPVLPRASTPAPPGPLPAPAATSPEPAPEPRVRPDLAAVYHDDFARPVLYTWTTPPQIEALRSSRRLLVAEGGVGEPSPYLRALDDLVAARGPGHELAALLRDHPGLRRRRYAWTSPLATTLGLGARRYGDALVRIELDPAALIVAYRPRDVAAPFALVDMSGRTVDLAVALADPGRIGAVYHVRDGPADPVAFREYIVCNEARVAAWSIATPELRARVDADIEWLESLRGDLAHLPAAAVRTPAASAWASAPTTLTPLDRWHAVLAFDNERYRPTPGNFAAIAAAMRGYDGRGEPLVHRPEATFP